VSESTLIPLLETLSSTRSPTEALEQHHELGQHSLTERSDATFDIAIRKIDLAFEYGRPRTRQGPRSEKGTLWGTKNPDPDNEREERCLTQVRTGLDPQHRQSWVGRNPLLACSKKGTTNKKFRCAIGNGRKSSTELIVRTKLNG